MLILKFSCLGKWILSMFSELPVSVLIQILSQKFKYFTSMNFPLTNY